MGSITHKAPETQEQQVPENEISKNAAVSTISDENKSSNDISGNGNTAHHPTVLEAEKSRSWLGYLKTKHFWIVLFFG